MASVEWPATTGAVLANSNPGRAMHDGQRHHSGGGNRRWLVDDHHAFDILSTGPPLR
jgi:hypothetical protein